MNNPFDRIDPFNKIDPIKNNIILKFKEYIKYKNKFELIEIQKLINQRLNEINLLETTQKITNYKTSINRTMYQ